MIRFVGQAIVTDIEGTTSSIAFVTEVLFPFARRGVASFLGERWDEPTIRAACEQIARDAGHASLDAWGGPGANEDDKRDKVIAEVYRLMDRDAKQTGLKELQGLIWEGGFADGTLRAHVYPDVKPALVRWQAMGRLLAVYSSGSINAQKLFFGHTIDGDLLGLFSAHFDTTIGSKRESDSYRRLASELRIPSKELLFLSDVVAELDAALEAGFQTGLALRPGNPDADNAADHPTFTSFSEIEVVG